MIQRVSLKMQAYAYLKDAIFSDKIKPGIVYSEQSFADILQISRTPVREAVLQLRQEGFVTIHPNKGISVKEDTEEEIRQLFQYRTALEGYCCMYAAENRDKPETQHMISVLEKLILREEQDDEENIPVDKYMERDSYFHMQIADFTQNPPIMETMHNLRLKIEKIGIKCIQKQEGRVRSAIEEHKAIVRSIKSGDGYRAYSAAREHFDAAMKAFLLKEDA